MWHVDKQCLVYRLPAGEICVQGTGHWFLGTKNPFLSLPLAGHYAQRQVGGIELATERIGVFAQDQLAHIIHQIFLADGDDGRRRARPLDPELAGHHVGADGQQLIRAALIEVIGLPVEEGPDQRCLSTGQ
jgi:hypothetical protein